MGEQRVFEEGMAVCKRECELRVKEVEEERRRERVDMEEKFGREVYHAERDGMEKLEKKTEELERTWGERVGALQTLVQIKDEQIGRGGGMGGTFRGRSASSEVRGRMPALPHPLTGGKGRGSGHAKGMQEPARTGFDARNAIREMSTPRRGGGWGTPRGSPLEQLMGGDGEEDEFGVRAQGGYFDWGGMER